VANVIIDSCTYGKIVKNRDWELLVENIINDKKFIVFNFEIIRKELRKAPKQVLTIYDQIVSTNKIFDNNKITNLAKEYYINYKNLGGGVGKNKIINDFKIVACASIKNCDLLFSDDRNTLKCKNALESYRIINLKKGYRTPTFYDINDLKKIYLTR
jgi:hypothetical protein